MLIIPLEICECKPYLLYRSNNFNKFLIYRIGDYSVVSTPNSVIYFGGDNRLNHYRPNNDQGIQIVDDDDVLDIVTEYSNRQWKILGKLAAPRIAHRSVYLNNKIYILGSGNK